MSDNNNRNTFFFFFLILQEMKLRSIYLSYLCINPFQNQGCAANGSLSKEDAAFICVEALDSIPQTGLIFEVCEISNLCEQLK